MTLLQVKFEQLPQDLIERIQATRTTNQLDTMFRQSVTATSLDEIEIK